jgi:hypothetical protein
MSDLKVRPPVPRSVARFEELALVVFCAVKDMDGVGQQVGDSFKGFDGAFWAAGEIDDQGFAAGGDYAAGEDGCRRLLQAFAAHFFGDAGDDAVGDGLGGFGGVIAGTDSGTAGRGDEVDAASIGELAEILADGGGIIGQAQAGGYFPTEAAAKGDHCGAGGVFAFPFGDRIGDGEDGNAHGKRMVANRNRRIKGSKVKK